MHFLFFFFFLLRSHIVLLCEPYKAVLICLITLETLWLWQINNLCLTVNEVSVGRSHFKDSSSTLVSH